MTFAVSVAGAFLQPRLQRRRATARDQPPVSMLLPIKLLDPGFDRAQTSAFTQRYAGYEVLAGCREEASPARDAMRAIAQAQGARSRILLSPGVGAVSPKLNTLAEPLARAVHDTIMTKDSNITLAPDSLATFMRSLTPAAGLVCAVPVAVRASGVAGRIEAILINRDARLLLTASAVGKGFGVGKVMLFRHGDLRRAGGVEALGHTIAEDSALCKAMASIGLRTVFAEATVDQEIGRRSFAEVFGRQRRWAVIRRAEEPASFRLEPLACPLPAAVAAAVAAPLFGLAGGTAFAATLLGWYALEVATTWLKGWEVEPWTPAAFLGRDAVLLAAWALAWTTRQVVWAGGRQDVRRLLDRS